MIKKGARVPRRRRRRGTPPLLNARRRRRPPKAGDGAQTLYCSGRAAIHPRASRGE